jgi:hypothetical protein
VATLRFTYVHIYVGLVTLDILQTLCRHLNRRSFCFILEVDRYALPACAAALRWRLSVRLLLPLLLLPPPPLCAAAVHRARSSALAISGISVAFGVYGGRVRHVWPVVSRALGLVNRH